MSETQEKPITIEKVRDLKIDRILQNTDEVKAVVVKNKAVRTESLKKAQSKFKKIGTNLKVEQAEIIENHCAKLGVSVSEYVKNLINEDLNPTIKPKPKFLDCLKSCFRF